MTTQNTTHTKVPEPDFSGNPAETDRFDHKQNNNYNFEPECALPGTALSCLNGLRHGHRARTLFIPGEQPQDFYTMLAEDFETHKPATVQDSGIVTDATLARWYLWRRQRSYSKSEFELYCANDQEDTLNPSDLRQLEQFDRYRIQAERGLARAMAGLRHLKKAELNDEKWRAQHELQKKRFDLDLQRFELRKEQELFALRQAEAKANEFKPEQFSHYMGVAEQMPVIEQIVYVSEKDGNAQIVHEPSNEIVQRMIQNRKRFFARPMFVSRIFHFENHHIPDEYHWVTLMTTPEALKEDEESGIGVRISLRLSSWRFICRGEANILAHAQQQNQQKAA